MEGQTADIAMITTEIYRQLTAGINSLEECGIIYMSVSADDRHVTILPKNWLSDSIAMRFTDITEGSKKNSIQEMQYERFIRTMAEMVEKYQADFQN